MKRELPEKPLIAHRLEKLALHFCALAERGGLGHLVQVGGE